jgi:hypothetical protein
MGERRHARSTKQPDTKTRTVLESCDENVSIFLPRAFVFVTQNFLSMRTVGGIAQLFVRETE